MPANRRRQAKAKTLQRRFPIGAELLGKERTHFRLWAPKARTLEVAVENGKSPVFYKLQREGNGYFSGEAPVGAGALYRFRLDETGEPYPDLASRYPPRGP